MQLPISLILLAIVALIGAFLIAILKAKSGSPGRDTGATRLDAYTLKKSLYSPAERSFLGVLDSLDLKGVSICAKVRLADIFNIKKGLGRSEWQNAFNRIKAKHVDFLIVQKSDGRPLLGIELDDQSHEEEERAARDTFVDGVFASAGLPLLHVAAKSTYDPKELHRLVYVSLGKMN